MTSEVALMVRLQAAAGRPGTAAARAYSTWGEHAFGWMGLGLAGALVDARRRRDWLAVTGGAFLAHGGAVVIKRVVRRRRPFDPRVEVRVPTPSDLSFPSAHTSSTTAAAVALAPMIGAPAATGLAATMALGRVALGVHYPSDVLTGVAVGVAAGTIARRCVESADR
ncbi:phosphatase PAP2 family protein [Nocardioides nitrophenolicus]|uniref:phosphatase PAP2 family protein n=1 Tax=Nocardioides nitrophenolicus TaxID=60489 RepID=UPI0019577D85|nr:phosphatase PAP2 family protein [Nocardioides nitrophenolicus]MBM7519386.1 membrane-associated phospholipid phosphatase [Nocardioides nitrophenolicus]